MLGKIAEKFPELIPQIEKAGHRIGAHGYNHADVFSMDKEKFEQDVHKVSGLINGIAARSLESFRAPNWSINNDCLWALEILKKYRYKYDSSSPQMLSLLDSPKEDQIIEIPRSGFQILKLRIPFGGAFLRIYPLDLMMHLMKQMNQKGLPFMLYIHPWEIDTDIPLLKTSKLDRIIQYHGVDRHLEKIQKILAAFEFVSIEEFFEKNGPDKQLLNNLYQFV